MFWSFAGQQQTDVREAFKFLGMLCRLQRRLELAHFQQRSYRLSRSCSPDGHRPMVLHHNEDNDRRSRPGFGYHVKVHSFRAATVILAWVLIFAAFYEKPELLTGAQRAIQRGIEVVGDAIPPPWGPRIEFVFREIGGLIWLQIALLIFALRLALSTFAFLARIAFRNGGN